jgi:hypothetical protein
MQATASPEIAGEEFAAHLVGAEPRQRWSGHIGLHPDRHRHPAAPDRAELLRHHQRVAVIEPLAAELDRLVETEKAEVAEFFEQLMGGENIGLLPFIDKGIDFRGDEFLQDAAGVFVVSGEEHYLISLQSELRCFILLVMAGLVPAIYLFLV